MRGLLKVTTTLGKPFSSAIFVTLRPLWMSPSQLSCSLLWTTVMVICHAAVAGFPSDYFASAWAWLSPIIQTWTWTRINIWPKLFHLTNSVRAILTELDLFYTHFHHIHFLQNIINVKYIGVFTNIYKIFLKCHEKQYLVYNSECH